MAGQWRPRWTAPADGGPSTPRPPGIGGFAIGVVPAVVVLLVGLTATLTLVALAGVVLLPGAAGRQRLNGFEWVAVVAFTLVGGRVVRGHPRNGVPWLMLGIGTLSAISMCGLTYGAASPVATWVAEWVWWPALGLLPIAFLLFPDGHLPSRRWRPALWISGVGLAVPTIALAAVATLQPYAISGPVPPPVAPLAVTILLTVARIGVVVALVAMLLAVAALVVRFRTAQADGRAHLRWLLAAAVLVPIAGVMDAAWSLPEAWVVGGAALPVAMGVAVTKYRLYQIGPLVNRSLVYGGLTGLVLAVYVTPVAVAGTFIEENDVPLPLVAAATVAVVFQPVRDRLQRAVNKLLYGERHDPYAVLSRLGERLERTLPADDVLPVVVETVAQALKVPYVAIELRDDTTYRPAAATGQPAGEPMRIPLTYQGDEVGRLVIGLRGAHEAFSDVDLRLLNDIARQTGVAAHAVRLTADLQRSRERLVTTREEERRRLRRDLHDGLGATLAGIVLQLDATRSLVGRDPDTAAQRLDKLRGEAQAAINDVRRLVYGLRPPQLDELGLRTALEELVSRLTQNAAAEPAHLQVDIDAPEALPPLEAAVEVAAYMIAAEALTNVVRHARATRCVLRLECTDVLVLTVQDNGRGLPEAGSRGVGLTSMHERAAELGGRFRVESRPGDGTVVHAELPIHGW